MKYFRNSVPVEDVEPESLWKLQNGFFILIDDDEFVAVEVFLYQNEFYEIEKPRI